jgi:hypothetical protein
MPAAPPGWMAELALANQVPDRRRTDHDLVGGHTSTTGLFEQRLRDDGAQ